MPWPREFVPYARNRLLTRAAWIGAATVRERFADTHKMRSWHLACKSVISSRAEVWRIPLWPG